jgi:glycosyltransferase involved in cell wall biosynthesis
LDERASISVAMCTRDGERFVAEQLASILGQRRLPDELVLLDDASTDATAAIAERALRDAPFSATVIRHKAPLGVTANFSTAISAVTGDVIVLADQDDVWHPGKLERIAAVLDRSDRAVAAFSDADLIDEAGNALRGSLWRRVGVSGAARRRLDAGAVLEQLVRWKVATGATLAFRSRLRPLLLPMPEGTLHDAWIALVASLAGDVVPIAKPLLSYRIHPGNTVGVLSRDPRALAAEHRADADARRHELAMFELAAKRTARIATRKDLALVERKVRFLRQRAGLAPDAAHRIGMVARSLALGRYHRLGHGTRSAVHDLVFGP